MFEVGDIIKCKDGCHLVNHQDNPTGPFKVLRVYIGSAIEIIHLDTDRKYVVTCYKYEKDKVYDRKQKLKKICSRLETL